MVGSDAEIHVNAVAPYAFVYTVTSADTVNFDLSTVTSAVFEIYREDGNVDSWPASLSGASPSSLTLTHVFEPGDVDRLERLIATPRMTAPGGDFYAKSKALRVKRPKDL